MDFTTVFLLFTILGGLGSHGFSLNIPVGSIQEYKEYKEYKQCKPKGSQIASKIIRFRGLPGQPGDKGERGIQNEIRVDGEPGEDVRPNYPAPPGTLCPCRMGQYGAVGENGFPGPRGETGDWGLPGLDGEPGPVGREGPRGAPGSPAPPETMLHPVKPGMMYIPFDKNGNLPNVMCHHFRRQAYVPGVPNSWLGWHEANKSGYLVHDKWLYHASRFVCPCSIRTPPVPTDLGTTQSQE